MNGKCALAADVNNCPHYNPARNATRIDARHGNTRICAICGQEFPCDGTRRNTCPEECRKIQAKEAQHRGDQKRGGRRAGSESVGEEE